MKRRGGMPPLDAADMVNHPPHYTSHPSGVEAIDITEHYGFNLGNVIKYLWRDGLKGGVAPLVDLKKARWYLDREIAKREKALKAEAAKTRGVADEFTVQPSAKFDRLLYGFDVVAPPGKRWPFLFGASL